LLNRWIAAAAFAATTTAAVADPGYYVVTPYSNEGIRTLDFRYWTVKAPGQSEVIWPEIGFGYGVNSRWTTELFISYIGSSQLATRPSTVNWQNDYLLTQGDKPYDLALHAQIVSKWDHGSQGAIEFGPVFQTEIGRTQVNANLFFERAFGTPQPTSTQLKYQWQLRRRLFPGVHFGAQGFGELGTWNHWDASDKQSHRAGPALFANFHFADKSVIQVQAAYLVGKVYAQRADMFTLRAHYDF
jgi:hypothetical protein